MNTTKNSPTKLVAITGNTFPVKDKLKALGGKWDAEKKAWMVPAGAASERAQQLVKDAGAPSRRSSGRPAARSFGARTYRARCGCSCHRSGSACRSCNFDGCEQADGMEDC